MAGEIGSDSQGTAIRDSLWGVVVLVVLVAGMVVFLQFRQELFDFFGDIGATSSQQALLQRVFIAFVAISAASIGTVAGKIVFGILSTESSSEEIALITWRALAFIGLTGLLVAVTLLSISSPDLESEFLWVAALATLLGVLYAKAEVSGAIRTESDLRRTRGRLEEISARLSDTETELEKTRAESERMDTELDETLLTLEDTRAELGETSTELESARTELERTNAELGETKNRLEETSSRLDGTEAELAETSSELATVKSETSEARIEFEQARSKLEETEAGLRDTETELEKTRAKLGEISTESKEEQSELKTARAELMAAQSEIEATRNELGNASTTSEEMKVALAELRTELEEKEREVEEARTELEDTRVESERTNTELEEALLRLEDTEDELSATSAALTEAQEELYGRLDDPDPAPSELVIENVGSDNGEEVLVKLTNDGTEPIALGGCSMVDGDGRRFRFGKGFELDADDSETFAIEKGFGIESTEPVTLYCDPNGDDPTGHIRWRN